MSRVVRDSDDESASDAEVEQPAASMVHQALPDKSNDCASITHQQTNGTNSAEKLYRQMQNAHSALIEPTPNTISRKRRRSVDDTNVAPRSPAAQAKPKRSKTTDVASSSNGHLKKPSARPISSKARGRHTDNDWDLPESQDADIGTNKSGNEDTQDKSISEGTVTQDGEGTQPGLGSPHVDPSPQDTIMDTSSSSRPAPTLTTTRTQPDLGFEQHNPNELFPESTYVTASMIPTPRTQEMEHNDASANDEGAAPPKDSIGRTQFATDDVDELQLPETDHDAQAAAHGRGSSRQEDASDDQWREKENDQGASTSDGRQGPEPTSDELVGLPKEMYKPRPSRSRGGAATQSPVVDVVATPSKTKKSRAKRSKTTGYSFLSPKSRLIEMGFTPSNADRALMETDYSFEAAAELLASETASQKAAMRKSCMKKLESVVEEDERRPTPEPLSPPLKPMESKAVAVNDTINLAKPAKTQGQPAVIVENDSGKKVSKKVDTARDSDQSSDEDDVVRPSTRVRKGTKPSTQAVTNATVELDAMPVTAQAAETILTEQIGGSKRGRGRPKKVDVVVDEEEDDDPAEEDCIEVSEPIIAKKGRGRPKKTAQKGTDEDVVEPGEPLVVIEEETDDTVQTSKDRSRKADVLQETTSNVPTPSKASPPAMKTIHTDTVQAQKTPTGKSAAVESSSPVKRHSPLNTGRVPFRVGMSRRSRVEPLLRIIRK